MVSQEKMQHERDQYWMQYALALADKAELAGEIPVGAVLIKDEQVIGEGWNMSICQHDPSAHAEMLAIRQGAIHLQNYRLLDTTLYVTLEPCAMCAGAIQASRIGRVVFGAWDERVGAAGSRYDLLRDARLGSAIEVISGVLETECSEVLKAFFEERRG